MSISNQTKASAANFSNTSKHVVTLGRFVKAGYGWTYDQPGIAYDGPVDTVTDLPIYYNSEGLIPVWANQSKHAA